MKLKIFSVFDSKAEAFLPPFFAGTKGQAIRSFSDAVQDSGHAFSKHCSDYTLFELGLFDDSDANIIMLPTPVSLGIAIEFINKEDL